MQLTGQGQGLYVWPRLSACLSVCLSPVLSASFCWSCLSSAAGFLCSVSLSLPMASPCLCPSPPLSARPGVSVGCVEPVGLRGARWWRAWRTQSCSLRGQQAARDGTDREADREEETERQADRERHTRTYTERESTRRVRPAGLTSTCCVCFCLCPAARGTHRFPTWCAPTRPAATRVWAF